LFGLEWRDVDFNDGELNVIRSIVCGVEGRCKTESSQKPVAMHSQLAGLLMAWRGQCKFNRDDDWLFATRYVMAKTLIGELRFFAIAFDRTPRSWTSINESGALVSRYLSGQMTRLSRGSSQKPAAMVLDR
jgi:hypothetical protein